VGARLQIAVVTAYPDEDWHSQRLAQAARKRGRVRIVRPEELEVRLGDGAAEVRAGGIDVRSFDVMLLPRALGERGSADFQLEAYRLCAELGVPLVNGIEALLAAVDKFRSSVLFERAGVATPPCAVVQTAAAAHAVMASWGAAVVKPLFGSLGRGVRLVRNLKDLNRLFRRQRALYLQAYVPAPDGDVRAFVVGDRVVAALRRVPRKGDFRTNARRAARVVAEELDARTQALAVAAAHAVGLAYTGVDLVFSERGPLVLEVNGAPRWEALAQMTGCDVAGAIVDHAISQRADSIGDHTPTARSLGNG
jgi:tetrahydromethanopterin:alpha-L-glutamate ligase